MLSERAKYSLYLLVLIPSIVCCLIVLSYLVFDRALRQALHNHAIIIILFLTLIQQVTIYPWMIHFSIREGEWQRSLIFCEIWTYLDWSIYITQMILFAWATMERHILIFHERWLITKKNRFLIHYLPYIFILLYCFNIYTMAFFYPPCENLLKSSVSYCLSICLSNYYIFYMWESIVHQLIPVVIIVVFSIGLLVRTVWHKHRMHQAVQWRKHRKMTVQLLSITLVYLVFSFPSTVVYTATFFISVEVVTDAAFQYTGFLSYFTFLVFPFVCALTLPGLRKKMKKTLNFRRRRATVHAMPLRTRPTIDPRQSTP